MRLRQLPPSAPEEHHPTPFVRTPDFLTAAQQDMLLDAVRKGPEHFAPASVLVKVRRNSSVWLAGMADALLPVPVAHGEGRPEFDAGVGFPDLEAWR